MPRIAGVNIRENAHILISLTDIFGIGRSLAAKICEAAGVNPQTKAKDLTESELDTLRQTITDGYTIEGDLRRVVSMNIKRLVDLNCYRGTRHRKGLPLRGQRTRTNARTRKGKVKSVRK